MAQTNLYVDTGDNCHPPGAIQYVWFDTAVFAMDGWTPTQLDQFEGAIVRAIAVWNEESNSQRTLRYGGRGGPKGRPGDANDTFISATIGA